MPPLEGNFTCIRGGRLAQRGERLPGVRRGQLASAGLAPARRKQAGRAQARAKTWNRTYTIIPRFMYAVADMPGAR
jgi:hypothetical protein